MICHKMFNYSLHKEPLTRSLFGLNFPASELIANIKRPLNCISSFNSISDLDTAHAHAHIYG